MNGRQGREARGENSASQSSVSRRGLLRNVPALAWLALARTHALAADSPAVGADGLPYLARRDVQEYLDDLVARHHFERTWLAEQFAQARYSEKAEQLNTPSQAPPWSRDWVDYRARYLDEPRVAEGVVFLRRERVALARMSLQFGVPAEVAVAIIGVETRYGRQTGTFRTLDVLLTLAFDYPRRAELYREELAQFLLLCREQRLDPMAQRGSFAGALGLPQFMPGSIRRFALDFDGDGRVDLMRSVDAIGSVGNFLYAHGWERGDPILFRAQADSSSVASVSRGIDATLHWRQLAALGVQIEGQLPDDALCLLIELAYVAVGGEDAVEFRVGTVNLGALLHYNRSYFYAAAVSELAGAIATRASAS
jgi:membrane-bound lytic murein transglycosylase B